MREVALLVCVGSHLPSMAALQEQLAHMRHESDSKVPESFSEMFGRVLESTASTNMVLLFTPVYDERLIASERLQQLSEKIYADLHLIRANNQELACDRYAFTGHWKPQVPIIDWDDGVQLPHVTGFQLPVRCKI